jgi:hypothetical protein
LTLGARRADAGAMARPTMLEAVKIQARMLIPVVRALESELGKEKAHALVGRALAEAHANFVASRTPVQDSHPRGDGDAFAYPVESEIVENTDTTLAINMTACEFARYFRSIGEPEIEPERDIVVKALDGAAAAGVVPVVAAGNDFDTYGLGSIGSPCVSSRAWRDKNFRWSSEGSTSSDIASANGLPCSSAIRLAKASACS